MPRPFVLVESVDTPEGPLELRQRGEQDFMITVGKRVLMSSMLTRSELAVAQKACDTIRNRPAPRVLIGGLGLGYTLRATLDNIPKAGRVEVAELNPVVERWCRGPLAVLTKNAVADKRVQVVIGDVTTLIRKAAAGAEKYDAIILDLYVGPGTLTKGQRDPLYGSDILRATFAALTPGGAYTVWSEEPNESFESRLGYAGFRGELIRPQGGGPRHAVYRALKPKK
jgi:spermidine synthase